MKSHLDKILGNTGHSKDHTPQPHWHGGRGRRILSSVNDAEGYDSIDDFPSHSGMSKVYGWESNGAHFNWDIFNRWLDSQVGRKMDDIRSEVAKNCTKDNYANRKLKDRLSGMRWVPAKVELRGEDTSSIHLMFVSLDGSHIFGHAWKGDLYLDGDGFLRKVPTKLLKEVEALRQRSAESFQSVTWIEDRGFYKLNGNWVELTLGLEAFCYAPCHLCWKLKIDWASNYYRLFGKRVYCTAFRTLSRKEIANLGLNAR